MRLSVTKPYGWQKKGFKGLKGFVNGVLRTIAREKYKLVFDDLSVKYSMPEWIVTQWTKEYGQQTAVKMLESQYTERPVTIRVNLSKISTETLKNRLESEGVTAHHVEGMDCALAISGYDHIRGIPVFSGRIVSGAGCKLHVGRPACRTQAG